MTKVSLRQLEQFTLLTIAALATAHALPVQATQPTPSEHIANPAFATQAQANPLLAIDQNRVTVVDRIVREWGESLTWSNAGINNVQLREMLMGLRADHLLAASLAGNLDGLRNVLANALTSTAQVTASLLQAKALGDVGDDLVYTPVTPCRVVDSRFGGGGTLAAGATRNWLAANPGGNFTAQGGSGTNCGITIKPAAVLVNITVANTGAGPAFLTAWPYNQAQPLASTLNWTSGNTQIANAVIVPLCTGACADDFSFYVSSATDVIVDIAGYFARPKNYGGTHVITGLYATDSGGFSNTASGLYSTVAGGAGNTASAGSSTVGGGNGTTASGSYSTVAGGSTNTAFGYASFAAGSFANANYDGCFVWGDNTTTNLVQCDAANRFVVRAEGGIFMFAGNDGINAQTHYTGVGVAPGAQAWTAQSDRAGKDNLRPVNAKEVLRKVATMPITTWNWRSQDPLIRHMGPMAQDFAAAFGLGETPKGISTIDADGVALAAIQGLAQELTARDARIERQRLQIKAQQRRIEALEDSIAHLQGVYRK